MLAVSLLAASLLLAGGCREMKPPPGAEESATDLDVDMGGEAKDDAPEEPVAPQKDADAEKDAAADKAPAAEKSDAPAEKPAGEAQ